MGKLICTDQYKGLTKEEKEEKIERDKKTGDTVILVKGERPFNLTEEAITNVAFHEYKRYKHNQLDLVRIKEYEVPGILAILKGCQDIDVRQAASDLHSME